MTALIIDDEPNCCRTIEMLLHKYVPDIQVAGTCTDGIEGMEAIGRLQPDIVFLDIEMPRLNGLEMLEKLPGINFHLVFTTSYDQYALKAFRFSAIDYLLKPVGKDDLLRAMQKIRKFSRTDPQQIELLMQKMQQPRSITRMAAPTTEGLQMIPIDQIISGEANDNYTILHQKTGKPLLISQTLKDVEDTLSDHAFLRVHRCHLININEIEKYVRGEGGYVVMSNGSTIDVSRAKKETLLRHLLPHRE
ncbi:MAG TPA: response regulator [Phnomibacter sp.]|nr:response regulator [Phnomibacter sp.]